MKTQYIMETQNLSFQYEDGTSALSNLTLHFEKGKTTCLLGGNGAGKSTLFLHLNGILTPSSGQILYKGEPISYSKKGLSLLRQQVGIVFQDPDTQLFSSNVYEDVSFGLVNLGVPKEIAKNRIEKALHQTGIYELRHKPTHSLSYGQKKRVALAGIVVMEPEVLILDEPTAGLDPKGIQEILDLINTLKKELHISIIMATHDMNLIPIMCDYVYVLKSGALYDFGTVQEVFSRPNNLYSAGLCLPYISQLMQNLKIHYQLPLTDLPSTVEEASLSLKPFIYK